MPDQRGTAASYRWRHGQQDRARVMGRGRAASDWLPALPVCAAARRQALRCRWPESPGLKSSGPACKVPGIPTQRPGAVLETAPVRCGAGREGPPLWPDQLRSEEHTSELQSLRHLVCGLLLDKRRRDDDGVNASRHLLRGGRRLGPVEMNLDRAARPLVFLMIRQPPRSTLFPYPTLFRSGLQLCVPGASDTRGSSLKCQRIRLTKAGDRKSTRLNSSHLGISYAVFCLT